MSKYRIKMNGKEYEMEVELVDGNAPAASAPNTPVKAAAPVASAPAASKIVAAAEGSVISPMPGTILKVNVTEGASVKTGDSVVVLEAMKMENDITAPKDGRIKSLFVAQGQAVAKGDALFEVE
ncbi:MAG: biotin/lipoyl-binding protein [Clostridiales bacterium]|nr:biotin/lipoyl-binding protein [Clostridiales bacterium]